MEKVLPEIVTSPKKKDLHAEIKAVWLREKDCLVLDECISVHFAETESAWRAGVIGIEIEGVRAYVSIDALLSTVYTAYDPTLLKKGVYFFEHLWIQVMSFFIRLKNKK